MPKFSQLRINGRGFYCIASIRLTMPRRQMPPCAGIRGPNKSTLKVGRAGKFVTVARETGTRWQFARPAQR